MLDAMGEAAFPMLVQPMVEPGADVRVAVEDWRRMQATLAADAGMIEDTGGDPEGASLMRWFMLTPSMARLTLPVFFSWMREPTTSTMSERLSRSSMKD